jgi:hypothetical protein
VIHERYEIREFNSYESGLPLRDARIDLEAFF